MFTQLRAKLKRARRWLSRNETVVRWLGLSRSVGTRDQQGLVLIQIDGLSRTQFERALKRRRMPFLRKLMRKRGYQIDTMYSGLPSTTPAVQGELFYGVKCAVPAFGFRDSKTRQIVAMFDATPAHNVQERLAARGAGLLEGGSDYSNIYSGGAAEPHFCAATMGWSAVTRAINPFVLVSIVFWHMWSIVRTLALVLLELVIAVGDLIRGQIQGRNFWHELSFIPIRVAVNIGLRELITVGASVDVTRGLPVVQVNFLGYDEQSHHRGPSSAFAHWTLKGIDDAIKRIWRAAHRSERRRYSIWIYSDHGQERAIPYTRRFGRPVNEAIAEVFGQDVISEPANRNQRSSDPRFSRAQWIGGRAGRRLARRHERFRHVEHPPAHAQKPNGKVEVVSLGPLGHVYPEETLDESRIEDLAWALVDVAHIPMVLTTAGDGKARVWCRQGTCLLPDEAEQVFGPDHPFLTELGADMACLVHHPDAGKLVISGWSRGQTPITFAVENGAHAGPGPEETRAFVFLPQEAPLKRDRAYLRPVHLRHAAMAFLGRLTGPEQEVEVVNGAELACAQATAQSPGSGDTVDAASPPSKSASPVES